MTGKTRRGNRWGLALVGLLLMVLGGLGLARGLRAMPQDWAPADTPLINEPVRAAFSHPWVWALVAAAAIVLAVLCVRWLLVQTRRETVRTLRMESPGGTTEVAASSVTQAAAAELAASPLVLNASADLAGDAEHPEVRLRVVADERAPIGEVIDRLATVAIPHMRTALEAEHLPAVATVSLAPAPPPERVVL
ncbi:alkaline shock response membrane anchor protein AmaP [Nonomuraea soli]|uniref:Alkaline shock response membrane anchor protein AmaP n=1 Tax=Nonomuraea soli TaxID=1032476 RepID=A0A7W0CJ20_9ACTN|nr:alkaline shock response membrane anchor protein AmaP [Nonomuraea soli]MBA2892066.1 hypothetical protein [Nonomuraea soli]